MEKLLGEQTAEFYSGLILDMSDKMREIENRLKSREEEESEFMKYMLRYAAHNQDLTTLSAIVAKVRQDVDQLHKSELP